MKYETTSSKLADFGRLLLTKKSIVEGLPHISKYAKDVINAQRCSIFIYDAKTKDLWTTIADGVEKIVVSDKNGVVGQTIKEKKPLIENDPYSNPKFLQEIDKKTGFVTQNLITSPIFNSKREVIGVMELLNKTGGFDLEDSKFMIFFAHYISGFLELINLYELKEEKNKNDE